MAKIQLDIDRKLHSEIKQIQIERELKGETVNLRQIYEEVITLGLQEIKKATQN